MEGSICRAKCLYHKNKHEIKSNISSAAVHATMTHTPAQANKQTNRQITHLGRYPNQLLGVHVALALLGLLDVGERGRDDDGLAIVGEALDRRYDNRNVFGSGSG